MLNKLNLHTASIEVEKHNTDTSKKIYISGPVSMYNDPDFALNKFNIFSDKLNRYIRSGGTFNNGEITFDNAIVVNPLSFNLSLEGIDKMTWADFMVVSFMLLNTCDYILMMPNHELSEGAKLEKLFAEKSNNITLLVADKLSQLPTS